MIQQSDYGVSPEQYHAGLDKLWKALGLTTVQDEDVFTLAAREIHRLNEKLATIRQKLEDIVCTKGCDSGIVMLSQDGPCHTEIIDGQRMQVYNHEYFSPLGDALIELYEIAGGDVT